MHTNTQSKSGSPGSRGSHIDRDLHAHQHTVQKWVSWVSRVAYRQRLTYSPTEQRLNNLSHSLTYFAITDCVRSPLWSSGRNVRYLSRLRKAVKVQSWRVEDSHKFLRIPASFT